jgi:kynureninase
MRSLWIVLFGANFANSLFMAYVLVSMWLHSSNSVLLIEPSTLIITVEAVFSVGIVMLTVVAGVWSLFKRFQRLNS